MMPALFLAVFLGRPFPLVDVVYAAGGLDAVALVECESNFNPQAVRREPRGHSSYGLFQLDNEWHPQYRKDLTQHIAYGTELLGKCKGGDEYSLREQSLSAVRAGARTGRDALTSRVAAPRNKKTADFAYAVAVYNGGTHPGPYSIAWGKRVQAKRDELVRWLSWRFIRDLGVVTGG